MPTLDFQSVSINSDEELYIIPCEDGYSCLGFDVCLSRIRRLEVEAGLMASSPSRGSMAAYERLSELQKMARVRYEATGQRSNAELTPELIGLEGKHVEVVTAWGETVRFYVGRSMGWIPVHLALKTKRSSGGPAVCLGQPRSVRVIGSRA